MRAQNKAVALGLERPVVDRFRLVTSPCDQAADLLRGCDANANRVKVRVCIGQSKGLERYKVLLRFLRLNRGARGSQGQITSLSFWETVPAYFFTRSIESI